MIRSPSRSARALVLAGITMLATALHAPLQGAAQATPTESDADIADFNDLDGFQRGASRTYVSEAIAESGGVATADPQVPGLVALSAIVVEYDTDANAARAFDWARADFQKTLVEDNGVEIVEREIAPIGDKAGAFAGTFSVEEGDGTIVVVIVQKGTLIYADFAFSIASEPLEEATALLRDMMSRAPGPGEGDYADDGTSTGGLWEVFPTEGSYLEGLTPDSDDVLYAHGT